MSMSMGASVSWTTKFQDLFWGNVRLDPYVSPERVRNNPLRAEELPQQETKPSWSPCPLLLIIKMRGICGRGPWWQGNPCWGRSFCSLICDYLHVHKWLVFYNQMCLEREAGPKHSRDILTLPSFMSHCCEGCFGGWLEVLKEAALRCNKQKSPESCCRFVIQMRRLKVEQLKHLQHLSREKRMQIWETTSCLFFNGNLVGYWQMFMDVINE